MHEWLELDELLDNGAGMEPAEWRLAVEARIHFITPEQWARHDRPGDVEAVWPMCATVTKRGHLCKNPMDLLGLDRMSWWREPDAPEAPFLPLSMRAELDAGVCTFHATLQRR